MCQDYSRIRKL